VVFKNRKEPLTQSTISPFTQNIYLCASFNTVCSGINVVMIKYNTLLYYCYSTIADAEQFAADHLKFCKSLGLTGRIIVAEEGLNGTVSGTAEACKTYMDTLHADERFRRNRF
jgi:UPF0176 protein